MSKLLAILALVLCACASEVGVLPAEPPPSPEPVQACYASFQSTLAAWEAASGSVVPEECRYLDEEFEVVRTRQIQCDMEPHRYGVLAMGCMLPGQRVIQILDELGDAAAVEMSVHEWLHALTSCIYGDTDSGHLRARMWGADVSGSAEDAALAAVKPGPCL